MPFLFLVGQFLKTNILSSEIAQPVQNVHRHFLFLIGQLKKSSLKPFRQVNSNLVGSTNGRICIQFPQNRMKGERHRLSLLSLQLNYSTVYFTKCSLPSDQCKCSIFLQTIIYIYIINLISFLKFDWQIPNHMIYCINKGCTVNNFCNTENSRLHGHTARY